MRRDEDDDLGPVVSKKQLPMPGNFVTPSPAPLATRQPPQTVDAPAWLVSRESLPIAATWETGPGAKETTSAVDRAEAVRIRLMPFAWLWAGVGVVLGLTVYIVAGSVPGAALGAVLAFAGLTGVTYYKLNGQDYAHSNGGVERLRITEASSLAREQMRHEQELRRMALESYIKQIEGRER